MKLFVVRQADEVMDLLRKLGVTSVSDFRIDTICGETYLCVNVTDISLIGDGADAPTPAWGNGSGYGVSLFRVHDPEDVGSPLNASTETDFASEIFLNDITNEVADTLTDPSIIDIAYTLAEVDTTETDPQIIDPNSVSVYLPQPSGATTNAQVILKVDGGMGALKSQNGRAVDASRLDLLTGDLVLTGSGQLGQQNGYGDVEVDYSLKSWPQVTQFPLRCIIERLVFVARTIGGTPAVIDWAIYEDAGYRLLIQEGQTTLSSEETAVETINRVSVAQSVAQASAHKRYLRVTCSQDASFDVFCYWRERA